MQPPISRTIPVKAFGQLPGKIVFREIEEISGITLDEYLNTIKMIGPDGQPLVNNSVDLKIDTGSGQIDNVGVDII